MFKLLPYLLILLTGKSRYKPEIKWSDNSWTHNIFRLYELIFWRKEGIKIESSAARYTNKAGERVTEYKIYTFEAACAFAETWLRELFRFNPIRITVLQLSVPNQELRIPFISFAIAYDTAANGGSNTSASDSWSHTCTGTDLVIVGMMGVRDTAGDDRVVLSYTYNSVALTEIRTDDDDSIDIATAIWSLANPSTGANTAAITWDASILTASAGITISLTGVDQSSPNDANNGASGSSGNSSVSVVTVADNAWIVDVMFTGEAGSSNIVAAGTDHTERVEIDLSLDNICAGTTGPVTPAGSRNITWFWIGTEDWVITAASFKPAGGGGGTSVKDIIGSGFIPFAR